MRRVGDACSLSSVICRSEASFISFIYSSDHPFIVVNLYFLRKTIPGDSQVSDGWDVHDHGNGQDPAIEYLLLLSQVTIALNPFVTQIDNQAGLGPYGDA